MKIVAVITVKGAFYFEPVSTGSLVPLSVLFAVVCPFVPVLGAVAST